MVYKINSIIEKYNLAIDHCYTGIENELSNTGIQYFIRKESGKMGDSSIFYFIIELIAKYKMDDYDYGINIDVQIKEIKASVQVQIDISKSNGSIYFEKSYIVLQNDKINNKALKNSIEHIIGLPKDFVKLFIKDYFGN